MPQHLPAYYDRSRRTFFAVDTRGEWIELNETSFRRWLHKNGFSNKQKNGAISPLDATVVEYQTRFNVDYAGPLAGFSAGFLEIGGYRLLVTSAPKLIEPKPGEWPTIRRLLEGMFGQRQLPHLYGWLKVALECLRARQPRPGQALVIAGPHDCGKSLLQALITLLFGGRAGKPFRYMSGETPFNGELFGAEHWMIEDEPAATGHKARRHFGARIKDFCVNEYLSCHPKGRPAMNLPPFRRVSITVNEEPENLLILPPLDESLIDKLILLRASKRPMPLPTHSLAERKAFWDALVAELPAFIHFLLQWPIPTELRSERFGIVHYQDPELVMTLNELEPEEQTLALIDTYLFTGDPREQWEGTAEELTELLLESTSDSILRPAKGS